MQIGLLWFDSDPERALADKVAKAADRYHMRFGRRPNLCFVHPSTLPAGLTDCDGVRIVPSSSVLENHFWIGEEELVELPDAA